MRRLALLLIALLAAVPAAAQTTHEVTPLSASRDVIQLTPAARTKGVPVIVDHTDVVAIMVMATSRTLTVTLTGPGGTR